MIKNITIGAFILALSFVGYTQTVHSGKPIKQYDTTDTNPEPSGGGGGAIVVHTGRVGAGKIQEHFVKSIPVYRIPRDGTIQNMRIFIEDAYYCPSDGPLDVTIVVNDRPTSLSTTVPIGFTGGIDVPGTVDVFGGDRITVETNSRQVRDYCWVALMSVSYEIL